MIDVYDGVWIRNTGEMPQFSKVDIVLSEDEENYPGVPIIRYGQDPKEWDWTKHGVHITHYRSVI